MKTWLSPTQASSAILLTGLLILVSGDSAGNQADSPEASDAEFDELKLRQAELFLNLQETRLRKAEAANRRVPNTYPQRGIENLKLNVDLAKRILESDRSGGDRARHGSYLLYAQNAIEKASAALEQAERLQDRAPSAVREEDLAILRAQLEVSKLNLQVGEAAVRRSLEDGLEWKVDLLYGEVLRLRKEVTEMRRGR